MTRRSREAPPLSLFGSATLDDVDELARSLHNSTGPAELNFGRLEDLDGLSLTSLIAALRLAAPRLGGVRILPPVRSRTRASADASEEKFHSRQRLRALFRKDPINSLLSVSGVDIAGRELVEELPTSTVFDVKLLTGEKAYDEFLGSARSDRQLTLLWRDLWAEASQTHPTRIPEILLYELGRNVFEHSRSEDVLISLRRRTRRPSQIAPWMSRFFATLGGAGYLEVTLADFGIGLPDSFEDNENLRAHRSKLSRMEYEEFAIKFAFEAYGTRKSSAERLRRYAELLRKQESPGIVPPTGLYWVREICREARGLIGIRTGRSLCYFDFLSNPLQEQPHAASKISRKRRRAGRALNRPDLPGTHLFMLLPDRPQPHRRPISALSIPNTHSSTPGRTLSIEVSQRGTADLSDEEGQARAIIEAVDKARDLRGVLGVKTLALDLRGFELATKALYILVVEMMRLQDPTCNVVLLNANQVADFRWEINHFLLGEARKSLGFPHEWPLAVFDDSWNLVFVGVEKAMEEVLSRVYALNPSNFELTGSLASDVARHRLQHLVYVDENSGEGRWRFRLPDLREIVLTRLERELREELVSPEIFYEKPWFLLPSGGYSSGFFDVQKVLSRPHFQSTLEDWLRLAIQYQDIDVIVVAGIGQKGLEEILRRIAPHAQVLGVGNVFGEDTGELGPSWVRLSLLPATSRVAIVTSVLGSGQTVQRVIDNLPTRELGAAVTIVDARDERAVREGLVVPGQDKQNVEFVAAMHYPLSLSSELPRRATYSDVVVVDPVSSSPLFEPEADKPVDNPVIECQRELLFGLLEERRALAVGHYSVAGRHALYLVVTRALMRGSLESLSGMITADLGREFRKRQSEVRIDRIVFPVDSPGAELLSERLGANLGSAVKALERAPLENPWRYPWAEDEPIGSVLLYHNAISRGEGTWRLIDLLASWGAEELFSYVLVRRVGAQRVIYPEKVRRYGATEITTRYLFDLNIPVYTPADCPICAKTKRLELALNRKNIKRDEQDRILEDLDPYPLRSSDFLEDDDARMVILGSDSAQATLEALLRSVLEDAIGSAGAAAARKELAERVRNDDQTGTTTGALCRVLAREETHFLDAPARNQIIYSTFRRDLSLRIVQLLRTDEGPDRSTGKDMALVLSYLDPQAFRALGHQLEKYMSRATRRFLEEGGIRQRLPTRTRGEGAARQELEASRGLRPRQLTLSGVHGKLPGFLGGGERDTDLLRKALWHISPSAGPNWACTHVKSIVRTYHDGLSSKVDVETVIRGEWREVVRRIDEHILLDMEDLVSVLRSREIGLSAAKELEAAVVKLKLMLAGIKQLELRILQENGEALGEVADGFVRAVGRLQNVLLADGPDSILDTLRLLIPEAREVVQSVVNLGRLRRALDAKNIMLSLDLPHEPCYVFCEPNRLVRLLSNLIENLRHAFSEPSGLPTSRNARLSLVRDKDKGMLRIRLYDNGTLLPYEIGVGLGDIAASAEAVEGEFIAPRATEEANYTTEAGFNLQLIREELVGRWTMAEFS